jgi:hypothetical protein
MYPPLRRFLLRLGDFFVSIWLAKAFWHFIFPVAVKRNRFAAPRLVFNFIFATTNPSL